MFTLKSFFVDSSDLASIEMEPMLAVAFTFAGQSDKVGVELGEVR